MDPLHHHDSILPDQGQRPQFHQSASLRPSAQTSFEPSTKFTYRPKLGAVMTSMTYVLVRKSSTQIPCRATSHHYRRTF